MGAKVHCKSCLPGYYSMRDLNEDSNCSNWPLFYGDKALKNGQCYNGFFPQVFSDAYSGYDKDALKQKILEHEAIFKNQVYELHRVYRIQRDMMDEIKRRELHKHLIPIETSSSSTPLTSQMLSEDAYKWHIPSFPLTNSVTARQSISGAEIINSPLSFTRGNSGQAGPSPPQNGSCSKDCEVLDSRPSKVRKKLFDLQLPADEYIDTEEGDHSQDNKMSDISSCLSSRNLKIAHESSANFFLGVGVNIDCQVDAVKSGSCLKRSIELADLNEPIQVEEAIVPASVDFLGRAACHGEIKGFDLSAKSKSQFLPKEISQNSQHASNNITLSNICVENKANGRDWLSHMHEAEHCKRNLNSIPQALQSDKLPLHTLLPNRAHQPSGIILTDHNRGVLWKEAAIHCLEPSERSHNLSVLNQLEPAAASHVPSPYQIGSSRDVASAWSYSVSSWRKPSDKFTEELAAAQTCPSLFSSANQGGNSQSSGQSHEIFGNKWLLNSSSRSDHGCGNDLPNRNGFYHGSSSGSKEVPPPISSLGFDYLSCTKDDNVASERSINYGPGSYFKGSNAIDLNSVKDMNLDVVLSKSSSCDVVPWQRLEIIDGERKHEDHLAKLPWLKPKLASKNEATNTRDSNLVGLTFFQPSSNQFCKSENAKGPSQNFTQGIASGSGDHDFGAKMNDIGECLGNRKRLGFPIFGNPCTSKNESALASTSTSLCGPQGEDIQNERKNNVIDINVACDPTVPETPPQIAAAVLVEEKEMDKEVASLRNQIDLNLSVSEDEVTLAPCCVARTSGDMKIVVEIDLEAPPVLEVEEDLNPKEEIKQFLMPLESPQSKSEHPRDELAWIAAQAIVAISSGPQNCMEDTGCHPSETSLADSLLWFVDIISSCADDLECKHGTETRGLDGEGNEESSSNEIDYFEAMTLQLTEVKEEEYMPKPLVPEDKKAEETGATSGASRTQKGQARRGRQRRDFQRDILPCLTTLSRHEVTEDLQTFGGLMRATGHTWHSGLTRRNGTRNGGARGRRRSLVDTVSAEAASTFCNLSMQQFNSIEVGLEDRSLLGWGKTTRRPRRQRCPAGNPPTVPLT